MRSLTYEKQPVTLATVGMALSCATLWAGQSVAVKLAVEHLPPYRVMALRFLFACFVTGGWAVFRKRTLRLTRSQVRMVIVNALFLFTQVGLYTIGTSWTTSVHSIVIVSSFPFFAALACHYFLPGFPFNLRTMFGLAAAFLGVVVVFASRYTEPDVGNLPGDLLVLAAAACVGCKIAYVKSLLRTISPLQLVFWEAATAILLFLLTSVMLESDQPWSFSVSAVMAILYQGCAVSGIAFLLWATLLSRHSPNDVTIFRLATPMLGMLLGWLILSEPVTPYIIVGGILLAGGICWVTR